VVLGPYPLLRIVVSIAVNALALWICSALFGGVVITGFWAYAIGAAVLAFANTILKPILAILTLPLIVVTLGLFYLLINIAMVALAEWIAPNFSIDGFWDYVGVVFIVWVVNWASYSLIDQLGGARARTA
jgi:putative membrane protein